jgi:hypothetical protein
MAYTIWSHNQSSDNVFGAVGLRFVGIYHINICLVLHRTSQSWSLSWNFWVQILSLAQENHSSMLWVLFLLTLFRNRLKNSIYLFLILSKKSVDYDQVILPTGAPNLDVLSDQLTKQNTDYSAREPYHQSSTSQFEAKPVLVNN